MWHVQERRTFQAEQVVLYSRALSAPPARPVLAVTHVVRRYPIALIYEESFIFFGECWIYHEQRFVKL